MPNEAGRRTFSLTLHPSFLSVFFYRLATYFYRRRQRLIARFFWHINTLLTGAELDEDCEFGPGLVIVSPCGISLMAKAGRNLTIMPLAGLGAELGRNEDIGGGRGRPVLGDDVTLEPQSGVLGPVRIGSRVLIRGLTLVMRDVPDDTIVEGPNPRFLRRSDVANASGE